MALQLGEEDREREKEMTNINIFQYWKIGISA